MRKLWLVISLQFLGGNQMLMGGRGAAAAQPRNRAERNPLEVRVPTASSRFEFGSQSNAQIVPFDSLVSAEEFANEMLQSNPTMKYLIFESIAFLESIPAPPIKKKWGPAGELISAE